MQIIELHQHSEVVQNIATLLDFASIEYTIISTPEVLDDCYNLKGKKQTLCNFLKNPILDKALFTTILPEDLKNIDQFPAGKKAGIVHNVHSFFYRGKYKAPTYSIHNLKTVIRNVKTRVYPQHEEVINSMDYLFTPTLWMEDLVKKSQIHASSIQQIPFYYFKQNISQPPNGSIKIGIPGAINNRSRDYNLLFEAFSNLNLINHPVQLNFLGNGGSSDGKEVIKRFKTLERKGITSKSYLEFRPLEEYHLSLKSMDFLVIPCKTDYYFRNIKEVYGVSNMTGAESDMALYGTPSLWANSYPLPPALESISQRFHDSDSLSFLLDKWINDKKYFIYSSQNISETLSIEVQSKKLIQLLRSIDYL